MIGQFTRASLSRQSGVTLVELMVSITISAIIMAGVIQLYFTSSQTQRAQEGMARIQENMRYLFGKLEEDLTQSGHIGCMPFKSVDPDGASLIRNVLLDKKGGLYEFDGIVDGANDTGLRGSDTLVSRYFSAAAQIPLAAKMNGTQDTILLDDTDARYDLLKQGDIALVSDCSAGAVFMITNDPLTSNGVIEHDLGTTVDGQSNASLDLENEFGAKEGAGPISASHLFSGTAAVIEWELDTSAAGVAAGKVCSDAEKQYCALTRDGDEMAEGVEDFQVQYGWLNAADVLNYSDANAVTDWNAVRSVTVTLTLNSIQYAPTLDGEKLMSKQVSKTFMLRNQLPGEF